MYTHKGRRPYLSLFFHIIHLYKQTMNQTKYLAPLLLTFNNQEKSIYVPKSIGHFSPIMLQLAEGPRPLSEGLLKHWCHICYQCQNKDNHDKDNKDKDNNDKDKKDKEDHNIYGHDEDNHDKEDNDKDDNEYDNHEEDYHNEDCNYKDDDNKDNHNEHSQKVDFLAHFQGILNSKGYQNRIIGSKVTTILLNGWMLPIVRVALEGSVPAACTAGLFVSSPSHQEKVPVQQKHMKMLVEQSTVLVDTGIVLLDGSMPLTYLF